MAEEVEYSPCRGGALTPETSSGLIVSPLLNRNAGQRFLGIVANQMAVVLFDHGNARTRQLGYSQDWQACANQIRDHAMPQGISRRSMGKPR